MPNLIPPKIPDGERVDFDVSDTIQYLLCMDVCILVYYVELNKYRSQGGADMSSQLSLCKLFLALSTPAFNLGPKTNMCISITQNWVTESNRIYIAREWRRT